MTKIEWDSRVQHALTSIKGVHNRQCDIFGMVGKLRFINFDYIGLQLEELYPHTKLIYFHSKYSFQDVCVG